MSPRNNRIPLVGDDGELLVPDRSTEYHPMVVRVEEFDDSPEPFVEPDNVLPGAHEVTGWKAFRQFVQLMAIILVGGFIAFGLVRTPQDTVYRPTQPSSGYQDSPSQLTQTPYGSSWGSPSGWVFPSSTTSIEHVAWAPNGRQLALDNFDGTAHIWTIADGTQPFQPGQSVNGLAWSPNGQWLATASQNGLAVWDATTGEVLIGNTGAALTGTLVWSPDNSHVAVISEDRTTVKVWDTTGLPRLTSRNLQPANAQSQGQFNDVSWSPDGRQLAAVTTFAVILWDTRTWEQQVIRTLPYDAAGMQRFSKLAWSPDGQQLAISQISIRLAHNGRDSAQADVSVVVWDRAKGSEIVSFIAFQGNTGSMPDTQMIWTPDGTRLLTLTRGDHRVVVRDAQTGNFIETLTDHDSDNLAYMALSPDGKHLAVSSYFTVKIWRVVG